MMTSHDAHHFSHTYPWRDYLFPCQISTTPDDHPDVGQPHAPLGPKPRYNKTFMEGRTATDHSSTNNWHHHGHPGPKEISSHLVHVRYPTTQHRPISPIPIRSTSTLYPSRSQGITSPSTASDARATPCKRKHHSPPPTLEEDEDTGKVRIYPP